MTTLARSLMLASAIVVRTKLHNIIVRVHIPICHQTDFFEPNLLTKELSLTFISNIMLTKTNDMQQMY